jgi:hypothetical protein
MLRVLAWRATLYGQLEYIKAALLSNWVPKGGAVVLLSGGGTRDLYYMPKDTVKVTYVGEGLKKGLMENASIQVPLSPLLTAHSHCVLVHHVT